MKTGAFGLFFLTLSLSAFTGNSSGSGFDADVRLNPDCKIKRLSNGSVIVSTRNEDGVEVKHQFTDFFADLLMAFYRKQHTDFIMESFSKKYFLSEDECRREIKHALNVLAEWNIIQRSDHMASR
jgi:hypothetical protein